MRSLKLAGWALLAAALVVSVEVVITDLEMAGAAFFVWLLVVPSVLLFALIERYTVRRKWSAHLTYLVSLIPVTACFVMVLIGPNGDGVAHDIARLIRGSYLPEAFGAYLVLVLATRGRHAPNER